MHSSLLPLAMPKPAHLPSASLRNIASLALPTLLVTGCSTASSPSTLPLARVLPPTLQIQDHWGVAEVLDLYDQAVQAHKEESPKSELRPSAPAVGPTISIASFVNSEKTSQSGKAATKGSKHSEAGRGKNGRRGKQADALKVEAKLKAGLESMSW